MSRLFYRYGERITNRPSVVEILCEWESYAPDNNQFDTRIGNAGEYITAAYVLGDPAVVLETIALDISRAEEMPPTFEELTGNGTWKTHKPGGKTVVLVDLTTAPPLRGNEYANRVRHHAIERCWNLYEHIMTFSPVSAKNFHMNAGAYVARELPNSRPLHSTRRDGLVMQYK
ncbi:MAG TPA: hypothetical protein VJH04_00015 [archaeon]|nr:hypothetical protein [archaeon]